MTAFEKFQVFASCVSLLILIATVYYIAHSPVNAVKIGRHLNNEQQKDNAKRDLFLTLFALRGSPVHYDFVRGLNEIDVVFEDNQQVLTAWHKLYDSLNSPQVNPDSTWQLLRVELLSAMAVSLGYNKIRQTDMVRQYYPEGHGNQERSQYEFREIQKRYFEQSALMAEMVIENMISNQSKVEDNQAQ